VTLLTIRRIGFVAALGTLLVAGSASALTMTPGTVELDSRLGGTIQYELVDSRANDTLLLFEVTTEPLVGDVVVIAFDSIVIGGGVVDDPDEIIKFNLPLLFETQVVIDVEEGASSALFAVKLLKAPTRGAFFQNPLKDRDNPKVEVRFSSSAVPEPNAAIVFAVGLLVVQGAVRRRRR